MWKRLRESHGNSENFDEEEEIWVPSSFEAPVFAPASPLFLLASRIAQT